MSREEDLFHLWAERVRAVQPEGPEPAPEPPPPTAATAETREQRRSRRKREVRARTLRMRQMEPSTRRAEEREYHPVDTSAEYDRPRTREDCAGGARPCPWVSCKHHLFLDVAKTGGLKLVFPDLEVWEMTESCALDVADRAPGEGVTLEAAGELMNITRERIRQIERRGIAKLKRADRRENGVLAEAAEDEGYGRADRRRLPVITDEEDDDEGDSETAREGA